MPIYALGETEPTIDTTAYVHPDAVVIGAVELAADSSVWPGAVFRGDYGRIRIGERTSIQDGAVIHATARAPTVIGADCVVGHNAHLEGCTVEDGCLIGSLSVVLQRAIVRSGALVGAHALVGNRVEVPLARWPWACRPGCARTPSPRAPSPAPPRCTSPMRGASRRNCTGWIERPPEVS